jgi:acetaldehyde dehydrogenase
VAHDPSGRQRASVAIMGTGNIGTDLMYKVLRSERLTLGAMVGIDPHSDGIARARGLGVEANPGGIDWLLAHRDEFDLVLEATSGRVHEVHAPFYRDAGLQVIDLTPAALGPAVVPVVNLEANLETPNINLITCGGQATIPIVDAVARVTSVSYAEIISAVASTSAGPGTRQNIDAFTSKTADGLIQIGGARTGKAIIVLNPASPAITMRNTVYCALRDPVDEQEIVDSVVATVASVQKYVPGYRLRAEPLFDRGSFMTPGGSAESRVTVLLEVEGAGDYLPPYAGNLDIMTAAAVQVAESVLSRRPDPMEAARG